MDRSNPKKTNKKNPFYFRYFWLLVFLELIFIGAPGYWFLLRPEYALNSRLEAEISQEKTRLETSARQLVSLKKSNLNYAAISREDASKIDEILPSQLDLPSLYVNLEAIALDVGGELNSFAVKTDKDNVFRPLAKEKLGSKVENTADVPLPLKGELKQATISVTYAGISYTRMKKILETIETNLRLMDLVYYSFNPADSSIDLVITVYYLQ